MILLDAEPVSRTVHTVSPAMVAGVQVNQASAHWRSMPHSERW